MIADPKGTQDDWATATGVVKSNVNRRLTRLKRDGLVNGSGGKWSVTEKGKRTVLANPK
jgi:predicted transcriptional regulator